MVSEKTTISKDNNNVIAHVCELFILASYPDLTWLIITLTMTGKFFVSVGFSAIYMYTPEMYPTPIRAIGIGVGSMFARVGSLLAPFVADLVSLHCCSIGMQSIIEVHDIGCIMYMRSTSNAK